MQYIEGVFCDDNDCDFDASLDFVIAEDGSKVITSNYNCNFEAISNEDNSATTELLSKLAAQILLRQAAKEVLQADDIQTLCDRLHRFEKKFIIWDIDQLDVGDPDNFLNYSCLPTFNNYSEVDLNAVSSSDDKVLIKAQEWIVIDRK